MELHVDFNLAEHFSRGSSETSRTSSGIFCQPSVIFRLIRLDCVVLDNIQQPMHELIDIKNSLTVYGLSHWQ